MQKKALIHTICFMVGFSVIFFALGLSASLVGICSQTIVN